MGPIGIPELIIILVLVLLVFGARRLPEIGRSLGSGMREFKSGISGEEPPAERRERGLTQADGGRTEAQRALGRAPQDEPATTGARQGAGGEPVTEGAQATAEPVPARGPEAGAGPGPDAGRVDGR